MAGRFVSVPVTLSDLERPDARNIFFLRLIFIRSGTLLHLHKMCRAVCQRQVSFFLVNIYTVNGTEWLLAVVKCR